MQRACCYDNSCRYRPCDGPPQTHATVLSTRNTAKGSDHPRRTAKRLSNLRRNSVCSGLGQRRDAAEIPPNQRTQPGNAKICDDLRGAPPAACFGYTAPLFLLSAETGRGKCKHEERNERRNSRTNDRKWIKARPDRGNSRQNCANQKSNARRRQSCRPQQPYHHREREAAHQRNGRSRRQRTIYCRDAHNQHRHHDPDQPSRLQPVSCLGNRLPPACISLDPLYFLTHRPTSPPQ